MRAGHDAKLQSRLLLILDQRWKHNRNGGISAKGKRTHGSIKKQTSILIEGYLHGLYLLGHGRDIPNAQNIEEPCHQSDGYEYDTCSEYI